MSMNVDRLVSGVDTSALISSPLQVERQPQVRLRAKRAEAHKYVETYQQLNTRLDALDCAPMPRRSGASSDVGPEGFEPP